MIASNIKNLIKIIKFTPVLIICFACIFIVSFIYNEQEKEFIKEKSFIEKQFIEIEKNRIRANINTVYNYINQTKQKSEEKLKNDLRYQIDLAHKIITNIYEKNKTIHTKDEIIKQIKDALQTIRFNEGRGYVSIHTMQGVNILHPINPKFEGTSVLNRKDVRGKYPVQDSINILKTKNEAFMTWYYFKPNDKSKEFKKIGILKKFEPYNMIITTAEYVDDFEKNLQANVLKHLGELRFKNNSRVFVINYDGKMILNQSKDILNHNIFKEKEFFEFNNSLIKLISKENKEQETYIKTTASIDEGKNTNDIKISYVKKYETWKWLVGTTFNLSDASKIIEKRKIILEQKFDYYKSNVLIYGTIFTIILLIISFFVAKLIEKKFLEYNKKQEEHQKKELEDKDKLLCLEEEFTSFFELSINLQLISTTEGKIIQINKACEDMLGYKQDELLNTSFVDLLHRDDKDSTLKEMSKLSKGKNVYFFENRYKHKNGTYINLAWSATTDRKNELIFASAQNTTQSKLLEKEKKDKEKILYQQSKLAAMGEMLGNIAHQWRQPLSTISTGATGAKLQKEMNILSDEDFNYTMDSINNSAQYLSQTIEDFRGFFDPRNNKIDEFLVSTAIEKTFKLVSSQFVAKDIEIIQNIKDAKVISLENAFIQVLVNILNNSKDALLKTKKQKRLIFIDTYLKDDKLFIEIKDNAKGISDDIIDRIFEPYFTTKHQSQGTGIGLYMSQDIVKTLLKGSLSVKNEVFDYDGVEYKGAKFTIEIILI